MTFVLKISARKIRHYFGLHTVVVITFQQLKNVLTRPEVIGSLAQISIEIGEYNIKYAPRTSMTRQVIAEFSES